MTTNREKRDKNKGFTWQWFLLCFSKNEPLFRGLFRGLNNRLSVREPGLCVDSRSTTQSRTAPRASPAPSSFQKLWPRTYYSNLAKQKHTPQQHTTNHHNTTPRNASQHHGTHSTQQPTNTKQILAFSVHLLHLAHLLISMTTACCMNLAIHFA